MLYEIKGPVTIFSNVQALVFEDTSPDFNSLLFEQSGPITCVLPIRVAFVKPPYVTEHIELLFRFHFEEKKLNHYDLSVKRRSSELPMIGSEHNLDDSATLDLNDSLDSPDNRDSRDIIGPNSSHSDSPNLLNSLMVKFPREWNLDLAEMEFKNISTDWQQSDTDQNTSESYKLMVNMDVVVQLREELSENYANTEQSFVEFIF